MEKFMFYQDELVSVWKRSKFEVEANSKEEAIEKINQIDFKRGDIDDIGEFIESEVLSDTETLLEPSEQHSSTFEIVDPQTDKNVYSNAN